MVNQSGKNILPFPQVVRIEPAASCNFKCIHCPTGLDMSPTGIMSPETFTKVVSSLEKVITKQGHLFKVIVLYHGGEPLLNKNFFEMVRISKKLAGFVKTVTNGSKLNNEVIQKIIDSGLDHIEVSLDGISAGENDKIRINHVGATFDSISKQVIALIKMRRQKGKQTPKVFISNTQIPETTEQTVNEPQEPQYILDAFKDVADDITCKCAWAMVWPGMPVKTQNRPDFNFCIHVVQDITIRSNGDVVPCCYDLINKMPMGNILLEDLETLWNNQNYQNLRKDVEDFNPPNLCRGCPMLYNFKPMTKSDIFI